MAKSEVDKVTEELEGKKNPESVGFTTILTESANWLVIIFVGILYIAMGIMNFADGSVSINDFSSYTWLDWTLWGVITFVPAVMALVVSTTFKKEGIKQGKELIKVVIEAYQKLLYIDKTRVLRSEKQFLAQGARKEGAMKLVLALVLSFVAGQLFLNLTSDGILKIVINLSMWAMFGFSAFGKSFNYSKGELKEWYIKETGKLQKQKNEEDQVKEKEIAEKVAEAKVQLKLDLEKEAKEKEEKIALDAKIKKLEEEAKKHVNGPVVEPGGSTKL